VVSIAIGRTMKPPVVVVSAALTVAILLVVSFLIATGTRGEEASPFIGHAHDSHITE
jgi:hypothetical protein